MLKSESRNLLGNLTDMLLFFVVKIIPRILAILIIAYLLTKSPRAVIVLTIIVGLLVFYVSPPSLSAAFLLKKTCSADEKDLTLFKLLMASKDQKSGIFTIDDSFLIKSLYGKAGKYSNKIVEKYKLNRDHYEFLQRTGRKADFMEDYHDLLERLNTRLIKDKYGPDSPLASEVRRLHFGDIDAD